MPGPLPDEEEEEISLRRLVHIICEGEKTEPNYFGWFERYHMNAGRFELRIFKKDLFDIDTTDREDMVELMKGFITLETRTLYTAFQFSTVILRQLYQKIGTGDRRLHERFRKIRHHAVKEAIKLKASNNEGIVIDTKRMEKIVLDKSNSLMHEFGIEYEQLNIDMMFQNSKEVGENDRIYVVMDRDPDNIRTDDYYMGIIDKCEKMGYELLLSTPDFEFWLLLHHIDMEIVDQWKYSPYSKNLVADELNEKENRSYEQKPISEDRFKRYYKNTFEFALKNTQSPKLTLDLRELITTAGSNVGVKLRELM